MKTAKERYENFMEVYTTNWFDGLIKSWKTEPNKARLEQSYKNIGDLAVEAYIEKQKGE